MLHLLTFSLPRYYNFNLKFMHFFRTLCAFSTDQSSTHTHASAQTRLRVSCTIDSLLSSCHSFLEPFCIFMATTSTNLCVIDRTDNIVKSNDTGDNEPMNFIGLTNGSHHRMLQADRRIFTFTLESVISLPTLNSFSI